MRIRTGGITHFRDSFLPHTTQMNSSSAFITTPLAQRAGLRKQFTPLVCFLRESSKMAPVGAQRSQPQRVKICSNADLPNPTGELILEGDLLAYRDRAEGAWHIGAVIDIPKPNKYLVRSLCSRSLAEGQNLECFVDWEADSSEEPVEPGVYEIKLVDADYEERVIQDRIENPHGEFTEDCWRISTQLLSSFGVTIPSV